jgi:hypothetical protein
MHQAVCLLHFAPEEWAEHGVPIWLKVSAGKVKPFPEVKEALQPLGTSQPPRLVVATAAAYVPVRLPTGVDRDKVLDAMLTQLREVADLLGKVKKSGEAMPSSH